MPLWPTGREPQRILATLLVHLQRPRCERHSSTMLTSQVMVCLWWLRKLRLIDVWKLHFQVHPLGSSVSSAQLNVTDLKERLGHHSVWSQWQLQLQAPLKKLLWVNKPHKIYFRSRRGAKSSPEKNYLCLSRQWQEWRKHPEKAMGIQTTEEEGHLWSSPGPLGASKEMSWLLLPTCLPLPHQHLFLAALSESWE